MTATPVRLNGGGLGEINDKLLIGPSAKWLIKNKRLSPYDYYAPEVADLSSLRTSRGEYEAGAVEALLSKPKIYGDVVKYYKRLANGEKAICYCATVSHSQNMARTFCENGISACHIDAKTPAKERESIINRFRSGDIKILCNVDLISEGFDVPDCTASILLRPTKSLTLFIQQSMRCMRYQPDKRAVIIDHVGNVHRHGLPDAERSWTLKPKPAQQKRNMISVRQCPKEKKDAALVRIVSAYDSPRQCRNASELFAYAKAKNYKLGWAYYRAKEYGYLK